MAAWGTEALVPIQALYAMVYLGKLLGAPIAEPFLLNEQTMLKEEMFDNHSHAFYMNFHELGKGNTGLNLPKSGKIHFPFIIVACFLFVSGLLFATFQILGWTFEKISILKEINFVRKEAEDNKLSKLKRKRHITEDIQSLKIVLLLALFCIYFSSALRDNINNLFLFAIGVKSNLEMTKSMAALFVTTNLACGAAGRFAAVMYSYWINVHVQLFVQLGLCLLFCALVSLFALESVVSLNLLSLSLTRMYIWYLSQCIHIINLPQL